MARNSIWCSTGFYTWSHFFNVNLWDLFIIMKNIDVAKFSDDNTPYASVENIKILVKATRKDCMQDFQMDLK